MTAKKVTIHNLQLSTLRPSPVNQRAVIKKDSGLKELAASIEAQGLLQPIIVRPLAKSEKYEIVAGERRFHAFELLKRETIPALVKTLTDQEAHEITCIENLQREDLTPYEEGKSVQTLFAEGITAEEIADRVGKSVKWVRKRARLSELAPCWIKAIESPKNKFSQWSGAHLELIARYPQKKQEELFSNWKQYNDEHVAGWSVKELLQRLNENVLTLCSAPWKITDESLLPSAGACADCNQRSSCTPDLFDEITTKKAGHKDTCLNARCWGEKLLAYNTARIASMKEKHPKLLLMKTVYRGETRLPADNPWNDSTVGEYDFCSSTKKEKGSIPALIIDGPGTGSIKYVKCYGGQSEALPREKGTPKPLKERKAALQKRRVVRYLTKILQLINQHEPVPPVKGEQDKEPKPLSNAWKCPGQLLSHAELFRLIVALGCSDRDYSSFRGKPSWKMITDESETAEPELFNKVLSGVFVNLSAQLREAINYHPEKKIGDIFCQSLYLDNDKLWNMVLEEISEPKIWKSLNADGTKKEAPTRNCDTNKKKGKKAATKESAAIVKDLKMLIRNGGSVSPQGGTYV